MDFYSSGKTILRTYLFSLYYFDYKMLPDSKFVEQEIEQISVLR